MPNDAAAPITEPATVITTTVRAAPAAESKPSMLESLFGPKVSAVATYVHPVNVVTGKRMTAVFVIRSEDDADYTAERMSKLKPGTYHLVEKDGTQIIDTRTHIVEMADGAEASALTVHHPAAAMDIGSLLMGMQSILRESQSSNAEMMMKMQMENLRAQNELLQTMMKARGDGVAAASGMPPEIMQMLIAKAFAPAPSALSQLKELQQMQSIVGGGEENPMVEIAKGLGPVLAGLMAAAQGGGKPQKPVRTVSVVPGKPAAALAAPVEPVQASEPQPETAAPDQFTRLVEAVDGMARRGVPAESAFVALQALLEPEDFDQLATFVTAPGALDQLVVIAPSLALHREWLESLAQVLAAADAQPPAPTGDSNADQAPQA